MRTRSTWARVTLACVTGLLAVGVATPAFAAGPTPGPTAPPIAGTITIPTTLTLSINVTAFNLTPADTVAHWTGNTGGPGMGTLIVGSNDASGYQVLELGPTAWHGSSTTLPTGTVSSDTINNAAATNAYAAIPTPPTTLLVSSSTHVSGSYDFHGIGGGQDSATFAGFALTTALPANYAAQTFGPDNVLLSLWGN